jgi:hypothetical protein
VLLPGNPGLIFFLASRHEPVPNQHRPPTLPAVLLCPCCSIQPTPHQQLLLQYGSCPASHLHVHVLPPVHRLWGADGACLDAAALGGRPGNIHGVGGEEGDQGQAHGALRCQQCNQGGWVVGWAKAGILVYALATSAHVHHVLMHIIAVYAVESAVTAVW